MKLHVFFSLRFVIQLCVYLYWQEADFNVGPSSVSASRGVVVDFTMPLDATYLLTVAGRGRTEVNSWSFLFPLTSLVWGAIIACLAVVVTSLYFITTCVTRPTLAKDSLQTTYFDYIAVFLQQGEGPRLSAK